MAREKITVNANEFIDTMRQSAVPTYHTAKQTAPETSPTPTNVEEVKPEEKSQKTVSKTKVGEAVYKLRVDSIERECASLKMTEDEIDFMRTFLVNQDFKKVRDKGKEIVIREQHREMITNILSMVKNDANMATYIDNVLTEHFKQYYPTIVGIYKKCPPKF